MDPFSAKEKESFIKYGFARDNQCGTIVDEPLAMLAAVQWLDQQKRFSLFHCLQRNVSKHAPRKNGFKAYLAFYIQTIFEQNPPLDAVFVFRTDFAQRTDLCWRSNVFELVTVVGAANGDQSQVSVVTPLSGPACNIGFSAESGNEIVEWVTTNKQRAAFCFPPETFGPDVLCFIRSKQCGRLLLIVMQAKNYTKVQKEDVVHGVRTVTPSFFWKSKDKKVCCSNRLLGSALFDLSIV